MRGPGSPRAPLVLIPLRHAVPVRRIQHTPYLPPHGRVGLHPARRVFRNRVYAGSPVSLRRGGGGADVFERPGTNCRRGMEAIGRNSRPGAPRCVRGHAQSAVMPNHLHGIVVFADPVVDAPTCPRNYRALGTTSGDDSNESPDESDPVKPSTGGATESTDSSNSGKASTGGSTLLDGKCHAHGEPAGSDGESDDVRPTGPAPRSLGSFVAGFKSAATTRINDHRGTPGAPVWQRNYHDVIVRTERHWRNARAYIRRNPAEWDGDRLHRDRESNA